jgi:hypothetical protein
VCSGCSPECGWCDTQRTALAGYCSWGCWRAGTQRFGATLTYLRGWVSDHRALFAQMART